MVTWDDLEPEGWNPREGKRASIQRNMGPKLPLPFCLGLVRGQVCCKQMNTSFIGKNLDMASFLWAVWSSGLMVPALGEVTQPEPWWSSPAVCLARPHSAPGSKCFCVLFYFNF